MENFEMQRAYLNNLYSQENELLKELRKYGEGNKIPIISVEAEMLISTILSLKMPKNILEIGTAIGYSAIFMATAASEVRIVTIEVNEEMALRASENIEKTGFSDRISVICGDAKDILTELNKKNPYGDFDFVFIDAAKGHYKEYFNLAMGLLTKDAVIISDNILYKGFVAQPDLTPKRNKTIVKRMSEYVKYITSIHGVNTSLFAISDGMAVSIKM